MTLWLAPLLFALLVWWGSTSLIIRLDRLPRRTFRWSLLGASLVALAGLAGLIASSGHTTAFAAYIGFGSALLIWAWHEVTFLMGYITGPRLTACPNGCKGLRRFRLATATLIHHEIAILVSALLIIGMTWNQPNRIGLWAFLILWSMRLSAKLNLFLGVPNPGDKLLPKHLGYLGSYLRRRPMNLLFPLSITAGTVLTVFLAQQALAGDASLFTFTGFLLLSALAGLAVLEHWLMVLPLSETALWSWALNERSRGAARYRRHPVDPVPIRHT